MTASKAPAETFPEREAFALGGDPLSGELREVFAMPGSRFYRSPAYFRGKGGSSMNDMNEYTAVVQRDGRWWIGWLEEIPGVSSQGESREELMENLRSALAEALEMNRSEARLAAGEGFEEVRIQA